MITRPVRGASRGAGAHDGARRPRSAPATTRSTLTSLSTADFSGIERVVADTVNDPTVVRAGQREPAVAAGRRLHRRHRRRGVQGPPHRPHVRARGRHVAPAPGDQQADPGGGPVRRGRVGLLPGLGPDEALLPRRPARPRPTRTPSASPSWPSNCVAIGKRLHQPGRRSRPASAASCPSRTRRSSGSARTRSPSCAARSACSATPPPKARGVQLKWHDPRATLAEGIASRGDRRIGAVIERVWRAGGTFQEWSEKFDLGRWEEAMAAEGLSIDWYVHRHRTEDEVLPWDHISAGLHQRLPLAGLAGGAGRERRRGLPLDALLRLRRVHRLRPRARRRLARRPRPVAARAPGRTSPRRRGRRCPSRCAARRPSRSRSGEAAVRVRRPLLQARQGPLHQPPRRRPHVGAGLAPGRGAGGAAPRASAPPASVSFGLALSTGHESLAEYLDVELAPGTSLDLDELPDAAHRRRCPSASTSQAAGAVDAERSTVAAAGRHRRARWRIDVPGVDRRRGRSGRGRRPGRPDARRHPDPQGTRGHRRPPPRHRPAGRPSADRRPASHPRRRPRPPSPAPPPRRARRRGPPAAARPCSSRRGPGAAHPPMDRPRRRAHRAHRRLDGRRRSRSSSERADMRRDALDDRARRPGAARGAASRR